MFALRDAIYLIELAFYGPIIPAIIFILLIHGGKSPYTWLPIIIPLIILSGLRIAGASLGLVAMNPEKKGLLTTATILDTIGLAPVLCVLIGLLIRANTPVYMGLPRLVFIPLQLTVIAATVMTAYGGRDIYTSHHKVDEDRLLMRVGLAIFIFIFSTTIILAILTMLRVRARFYNTERTATICVLMCVPFMTVRLLYSAGSVFFTGDSVLNPVSDNDTCIWLHFLMVIVMEYATALSAAAVALTARKVIDLTLGKTISVSSSVA